jgi:hypothetical protein
MIHPGKGKIIGKMGDYSGREIGSFAKSARNGG